METTNAIHLKNAAKLPNYWGPFLYKTGNYASASSSMFRKILKTILPNAAIEFVNNKQLAREVRQHDDTFKDAETKDIFSQIYSRGMWGAPQEVDGFTSGHGSHWASIIEPYLDAVGSYLQTFTAPPDVVDLGCGDFNVGRSLRKYCGRYVACDVVPELIAYNRQKYQDLDVEFTCVDITTDPLPKGDVVTVRQVLQHLDNRHIQMALDNILGNDYIHLVVTELLPSRIFVPNLDQPMGSFSRLARGIHSGVVLTEPPFNLKPRAEMVICEVRRPKELLTTIVYDL